jgi:molecular chaperone GrpE
MNIDTGVANLHPDHAGKRTEGAQRPETPEQQVEAEARQFAMQKFATDVVEAAENLRRGLASIPQAVAGESEIVKRLRDGFIGVQRNFVDLLKRNGIEKGDPTGSTFDPKLHQAMAEQETGSHDPGTVLNALSAVWTLNGRLLRPAMVVVAKAFAKHLPASPSHHRDRG